MPMFRWILCGESWIVKVKWTKPGISDRKGRFSTEISTIAKGDELAHLNPFRPICVRPRRSGPKVFPKTSALNNKHKIK